ncbi:MAG: bifunctional phosphoserine phosphatase/homoserine phosphotransferase ThrH [Spirochaetales bacterium]|nr:bifunctional phosphoserine phosphatase/homoserine phosphotransferase ThrH [Spirochaetales bacterium]
MKLVCLDLEGVLVPEIWIHTAEKTGIDALKLTTRDISDYDVLMKKRLKILDQHGLTLSDIQDVINAMDPLEGANSFLQELRAKTQVIILSDTFEEFSRPLMRKLGWPTIFCNSLVVDEKSRILDYSLRQQDGKKKAVQAMVSIGFSVLAAGDSYNDLTMIREADHGALFKAPESIKQEHPDLPAIENYTDFMKVIDQFLQD